MTDNAAMDKPNQEPTDETPECPLCQISPILMGVGAAHTACSVVKDPENKAKCMAWVDAIKPEEIKNAKYIFRGILENAGIEAADRAAKVFNLGMENAILEDVGEKLAKGEKVDDQSLAAYKQIIKNNGV